MLGTKASTAAPPFVITFTICSSDFVFFIPDVASFLSGDELTGAPRLPELSFFGDSDFLGVGAFGAGLDVPFLGFESFLSTFPAFPFGATTFSGLFDLAGLGGDGRAGFDAEREFFLLSLLFEVAGRAFLAYTLACLAFAFGGI